MPESFENEMVVAILWITGLLLASMIYRKSKGKPIIYRKPAFPIFRQWNASGNSNRNWLTRIGGAHNCLVVQVADNELDIHPMAPFNWFFLPEIYGLEYRVPLAGIVSAKIIEKRLFGRKVEVEFRTSGGIEGVSLWLKKPEDFLAAIGH